MLFLPKCLAASLLLPATHEILLLPDRNQLFHLLCRIADTDFVFEWFLAIGAEVGQMEYVSRVVALVFLFIGLPEKDFSDHGRAF